MSDEDPSGFDHNLPMDDAPEGCSPPFYPTGPADPAGATFVLAQQQVSVLDMLVVCRKPYCNQLWLQCPHNFLWTKMEPDDIARNLVHLQGHNSDLLKDKVAHNRLFLNKVMASFNSYSRSSTLLTKNLEVFGDHPSDGYGLGDSSAGQLMINMLTHLHHTVQGLEAMKHSDYLATAYLRTIKTTENTNETEDDGLTHPLLMFHNRHFEKVRHLLAWWLEELYSHHMSWPKTQPKSSRQYKKQFVFDSLRDIEKSFGEPSDFEYCGDIYCTECRPFLVKIATSRLLEIMFQQAPSTHKGENNMSNAVKSEVKAGRILKLLKRFNEQRTTEKRIQERFNAFPNNRSFINSLRCSEEYLNQFIVVLMRNTTRKQVDDIMTEQLRMLLSKGDMTSYRREKAKKALVDAIESYYVTKKPKGNRTKTTTQAERVDAIHYLTEIFAGACHAAIDRQIEMNYSLASLHWGWKTSELNENDTAKKQLETILLPGPVMKTMFMQAYLTYDNDEAITTPISQKAKSIRAIGLAQDRLLTFICPIAHHITLRSAVESSNRDILMSLSRAFGQSVTSVLNKTVYIRTCPATPRPGVLPNISAKTPTEYVEGVKSTALSMLDPEHPDYDPEGSLVVQMWVKPLCSGVMGVDSEDFTVAFGNAGSTSGEGSEVVFTLSPEAQRRVQRDIKYLDLRDGMKHHEIEFVYQNTGTRTNLTWFREIACKRKTGQKIRRKPYITQVRGLNTPKPPLAPPPTVDGEPLIYRGNVPSGMVIQTTSMNVGQGSLKECYELEQMGKNGELPEGLVVYAPSGSPSAHVAGVSLDFGFAVVYGIKPQRHGNVWTEIEGWVTDKEGAEPSPYSPEPLLEFYKIGLRDGDRYWTHNLAGMSQFFHNFLSGPKNDPRLEGYLAGVYTSWIVKAALAVAMGEFRHGLHGKADFSPQRAFAHLAIQTAISGEANCQNFWSRSDYYERFDFNEIGYSVLHAMCKFYTDSYQGALVEWHSSSYGGFKYWKSIEPSVEVTLMVKTLLQGGDINLKTLLAKVNQLEAAVHNTGFFFNKFLGDKSAFDIGTKGHPDLAHAVEHWITVMPYFSLFYHQYVDEPYKVAPKHRAIHSVLLKRAAKGQKTQIDMMGEVDDIAAMAFDEGVLKLTLANAADDGKLGHETVGIYRKELQKMDGGKLHRHGVCGYMECPVGECKTVNILEELGVDKDQLQLIMKVVTSFIQQKAYYFLDYPCVEPNVAMLKVQSRGSRAIEQTVFVEKEREIEECTIEMTEHSVGSNPDNIVYLITKLEKILNPDTGERDRVKTTYIYADEVFAKWSGIVQEYTSTEEFSTNPLKAFKAWLDPPNDIDGDLYDMMADLVTLARLHDANLYTKLVHYCATGASGLSTSLYDTGSEPLLMPKILHHYLRGMLCYHSGHANNDSHVLCMLLHKSGDLHKILEGMK